MGLSNEELKRIKLAKSSSKQNKAIVSRSSNGLELRKRKMEELKKSLSNTNLESRVKALQARAMETASKEIEKRKKEKTEILFIFDKSGSCSGLESVTIDGFMDIIKKEQANDYNDLVTTVLFSNHEKIIHNRKPINTVKPFTYRANGQTALYDCLFKNIMRIKESQERDAVKPKKTLVVIMTDGEDNSSTIYNHQNVRQIIEERTKAGWEFIYLGANLDIYYEAARLGIKSKNAVEYSVFGIDSNFKAIERALEDIHESGEVKEDWSKPITDKKRMLGSAEKKHIKRLGRG